MKRKLPFGIRFVAEEPPVGGGDSEAEETSEVEAVEVTEGSEPSETEEQDDAGWDRARAMDKVRKANAEAKRLRERAKAAEEKATTATDAEARAVEAETRLMRVQEAYKLGLPLELADRLRGDTPEEVAQDAETLLALFEPKQQPKLTNRPKPKLVGGAQPEQDPELDADAIVAKALGL